MNYLTLRVSVHPQHNLRVSAHPQRTIQISLPSSLRSNATGVPSLGVPSLGVPDPGVQHEIRLHTSHITHRNPRPGPSRPCQRLLAWNPRGYPWSRPIDNVPGVLSKCTLQVYSPAHSLYTVHNPQMGGTDGLGLLWPHNRKQTRYS